MYRYLLLIAVFSIAGLFLMSGCSENKTENTVENKAVTSPVSTTDLQHHRFELAKVDGKPFEKRDERPMPFIEFGENFTMNGRICNTFRGQAALENGILTVKQMASTMMACPDDQGNELERIFGLMLDEGVKVRLSDDTLVLTGKDHELTYLLKDLVN